MFGWLGFRTGFPLWVSFRQNRDRIRDVEETFEGIASTRVALLQDWAEEYWGHMARLRQRLEQTAGASLLAEALAQEKVHSQLEAAYGRAGDFTELFVLGLDDRVIATTLASHAGASYKERLDGLAQGLRYARSSGQRLLYGPYPDSVTLQAGARSSAFHDRMTLMFIEPIVENGLWQGAICGRVPNDVLGDLIQRESGHVYPDSGDNYLFMAHSVLDSSIEPGTALSRSRFEDRTFTHGDNLKDGVRTAYGVVRVQEHTELELRFTDPATGQLHPGVAHTIRNGENLMASFPGYSDYRHIPVIGKGVTFSLPHHPDRWGMMCEGDLEEVYRIRGMEGRHRLSIVRGQWIGVPVFAALVSLLAQSGESPWTVAAAAIAAYVVLAIAAPLVTLRSVTRRSSRRLNKLTRFVRLNAEGGSDLTQRLKVEEYGQDELRELAKWMNNMFDSLEGIMLRVRSVATDMRHSQSEMSETAGELALSTEKVDRAMGEMVSGTVAQLGDIEGAKESAAQMRRQLGLMEEQAEREIALARGEVEHIGEAMGSIAQTVSESGQAIRSFVDAVSQVQEVLGAIEQISSQTHLLALNASIEASRAGESGRGFTVVAGEIRKLSDLTRRSTEEVRGMMEHIFEQASLATVSIEQGGAAMESGLATVETASRLLASAGSSRKQEVVGELALIMERIAEVSQHNGSLGAAAQRLMLALQEEMLRVQATASEAEAVAGLLQAQVGLFKLTESRVR